MDSALVVHLLEATKWCVVGVHGARATIVCEKNEQCVVKQGMLL